MENRIIFREKLTELKAAADEKGGILTQAEIREMLKTMPLEENHFQLIFDYLAEQKIRVVESEEEMNPGNACKGKALKEGKAGMKSAGYAEDSDPVPDEDERRSLSLYVDELASLSEINDAQELRLLERIRGGDDGAKESLIGIYLPLICSMAEEYGEEVLPAEDLIQEGNLGLLSAVNALGEFDSAAACRAHILNQIREAMEQAVSQGQDKHQMDEGLLSRINHLNEAVHNLERDLGHKVSAEEVSAYLEMPVEEIEDLLRVTGDQIETESFQ
ncbi:MAG: hypothetical protein LUF27_08550 [Lachnospiraceae bacterium]|nr:hypothetical protein [Lachnospiraceae bacterium]